MPKLSREASGYGRITLNYSCYQPLEFETTEDYSAWERAFLRCTLFNDVAVCFVKHPPQAQVIDKPERRKSAK